MQRSPLGFHRFQALAGYRPLLKPGLVWGRFRMPNKAAQLQRATLAHPRNPTTPTTRPFTKTFSIFPCGQRLPFRRHQQLPSHSKKVYQRLSNRQLKRAQSWVFCVRHRGDGSRPHCRTAYDTGPLSVNQPRG